MDDVRHPSRLPALAAHVFVLDIAAPVLSDADAHHLLRVLRLREGERLTASDGAGAWRECVVTGGALRADGDVERVAAPAPVITIGFALTKGDKPELTVQKLTELGVDRIVPIAAARSIVSWDDAKATRNVERLRAVARAAAMQSRRAFMPEVTNVTDLGAFSSDTTALAHPDGAQLSLDTPTVLIGPEGGWTDEEVARFAQRVDLGPTTLRAETAALAAGVVLTNLRYQGV